MGAEAGVHSRWTIIQPPDPVPPGIKDEASGGVLWPGPPGVQDREAPRGLAGGRGEPVNWAVKGERFIERVILAEGGPPPQES